VFARRRGSGEDRTAGIGRFWDLPRASSSKYSCVTRVEFHPPCLARLGPWEKRCEFRWDELSLFCPEPISPGEDTIVVSCWWLIDGGVLEATEQDWVVNSLSSTDAGT
jgi:hypothetical protein